MNEPTGASQFPAMREIHEVGKETREWTIGHPTLAARGITMAGVSQARQGFEFQTDGWAFGQLLICFGGEGRVRMHGKWRKCARGGVYVNPSGAPHAYHAIPGAPWKLCWLVYHAPFQDTPLAGLPHATLVSTDPRPLKAAVTGFRRESITRADPAVLRAWADVIYLLAMRVTQSAHGVDRLWRVWDSVSADLGLHWTVSQLAGLIGVSEEHLRRLCHERLGRTPMEHVTHLRMRRAAVLLRTTDMKIDAIAEQIAYADRFGFSAAFRRHFGASPAQYRREHEAILVRGAISRPNPDGQTPSEGQEAQFVKLAARPRTSNRRG